MQGDVKKQMPVLIALSLVLVLAVTYSVKKSMSRPGAGAEPPAQQQEQQLEARSSDNEDESGSAMAEPSSGGSAEVSTQFVGNPPRDPFEPRLSGDQPSQPVAPGNRPAVAVVPHGHSASADSGASGPAAGGGLGGSACSGATRGSTVPRHGRGPGSIRYCHPSRRGWRQILCPRGPEHWRWLRGEVDLPGRGGPEEQRPQHVLETRRIARCECKRTASPGGQVR